MDGVGAEWPFSTVLAAFGGWCGSGLGGSGKGWRGVYRWDKRGNFLELATLCRCLQSSIATRFACLHEGTRCI